MSHPTPNPKSLIPGGLAVAFVLSFLAPACGRKGPPLPPLVKLPSPPAEFTAQRHGDTVDLQFTVPAANTDGTRPANLSRVEVYGVTASGALTDEQLVEFGTTVASVPVKAPRDPNKTIAADESAAEMEPPEGVGLDQGAVARATEQLTVEMRTPVDLSTSKKRSRGGVGPAKAGPHEAGPHEAGRHDSAPLLAPDVSPLVRTYVGVGISSRGRRGPLSTPVAVALREPPPTPAPPMVDYDEHAVTVSWTPVPPPRSVQDPDAPGVLPSKPIGATPPTIAYNVYEVSADPDAAGPPALARLTSTPVEEPRFSDPRIAWDVKRCYAVRAVETVEDRSVEGHDTSPACVTLTDTFPPAAPKGLAALPSEGAINLIWDANSEKDLRGYIVLRGIDPAPTLEPVTATPIQETSFKDAVKPGVRFVYAVKAVDTAGNEGPLSERVYETAR